MPHPSDRPNSIPKRRPLSIGATRRGTLPGYRRDHIPSHYCHPKQTPCALNPSHRRYLSRLDSVRASPSTCGRGGLCAPSPACGCEMGEYLGLGVLFCVHNWSCGWGMAARGVKQDDGTCEPGEGVPVTSTLEPSRVIISMSERGGVRRGGRAADSPYGFSTQRCCICAWMHTTRTVDAQMLFKVISELITEAGAKPVICTVLSSYLMFRSTIGFLVGAKGSLLWHT